MFSNNIQHLIQFITLYLLNSLSFTFACTDKAQCSYATKYLIIDNGKNISFADAEKYCVTNYGTHLASIHDLDDFNQAAEQCGTLSNQHCWIGLNDNKTEGTYVWTDGTPYDYSLWKNGEPTGVVTENCIYMAPEYAMKWNDFDCRGYSNLNNFIVPAFLCNNPDYDEELACHCNCDVCLIEGDPHITTFDGLQFHYMGPCSYYYVTSCTPDNYTNLPFEIVGKHTECFPAASGRTCLEQLWINLYDENELVIQILLQEGLQATFTDEGTLYTSGNVPFNTYIKWDTDAGEEKAFYLTVTKDNLDLQLYVYDAKDYKVMDGRVLLPNSFAPNGWGAWADIYVAECYAENYQLCGLCGYYDFNVSNEFTYYNATTKQFTTISSTGVSTIKTMTQDAWNRTNQFGQQYVDYDLSDEETCGADIPLSPNCTSSGTIETLCASFWTKYCPCKDKSYYNLTWINSCIFDSCSVCPNLINMNLTQAVANGCFSISNVTCQASNCAPFNPTPYPTAVPTNRPTINPTSRPTVNPTNVPTYIPTNGPTFAPTNKPTYNPTNNPTPLPTAAPSVLQNLACELPYNLDLIIINDISCGLNEDDCTSQQDFIYSIIDNIKYSNTNPLIAYFEYSNNNNIVFNFDSSYNNNKASMLNLISSRNCGSDSTTSPYLAVQDAISLFNQHGQPSHDRVIILISNCYQNDGNDVCSLESNLNNANIKLLAVNLGSNVDPNTYDCFSINNENENIYYSETIDSDSLLFILDSINTQLCSLPTSQPTLPPTPKPTPRPTLSPTNVPTPRPTPRPTSAPTDVPTPRPTLAPTDVPTPRPTPRPTLTPTDAPTPRPTPRPTSAPTNPPTPRPTPRPTLAPTNPPTPKPTPRPSSPPTDVPTDRPTNKPTLTPTTTTTTAKPTWTVPTTTARPTWTVPTTTARPTWTVPTTTARPTWTVPTTTARPTWTVPTTTARPTWAVPTTTARPTTTTTTTTARPTTTTTTTTTARPTTTTTTTARPTTTTTTTARPTTTTTLQTTEASGTCLAYDSPQYSTCFTNLKNPSTGSYDIQRWGWSNGPYSSTYNSYFSRTLKLYSGAGQCDINKGTWVGNVIVTRYRCSITVKYEALSGYRFSETHLYVGTDKVYISDNKYCASWGQYPYSNEFSTSVTSYTYTISNNICDDFYVVAHAVVA